MRALVPNGISLILLGMVAAAVAAPEARPKEALPDRPPLPAILEIKTTPAALTLEDVRDARRVLVAGQSESGEWIDLTDDATYATSDGSVAAADADGYVSPRATGKTILKVSAGGRSAEVPVEVTDAESRKIRFVREIMPVMSNVGCNQGTCHGAAKGKNGFKLSLRGYDPGYDYAALIDDLSGRRFNRVNPDESLMLAKPAGKVPHEGGAVIKPGTRQYELIRQWIAEGAEPEAATERAISIEVIPARIDLSLPGMTQRLMVMAKYKDGSMREVTRDARFSSNQIEVLFVKGSKLTGLRRGEAAVLISYEGSFATAPVTIMGDRTGFAWTQFAQHNFIDEHVDRKLQQMKIQPSDLCTDADFIRRVSLDLTGLPPAPERVEAFIADARPTREKRDALTSELIGSREYVEYWTNKWADLLQCNKEQLGEKAVWLFREWMRDSIATNKPYDKFVSELLTAHGSNFDSPASNYYRVLREPGKITEDVSQTFLGVRFNCAKCHDHPFERWTQNQYYEFGAYFARVGFKQGGLPGEEIIYTRFDPNEVHHPKTDSVMNPHVPFGDAPQSEGGERNAMFVKWLTSKDNPLFAKALSNRMWSYFFGRGIIDPVDDIRSSNPASNPALLDALTETFIKSGFDTRALMKIICQSRAYQASNKTNKWNEDDGINFSHAIPRRLSAEQLMDAIAAATGSRPSLPGMPADMRPAEVADGAVAGDDFLALFGRPQRKSACECERSNSLSLSHALNLINGRTISDALATPDNRIAKLIRNESDDRKVITGIFLAILSRPPSEKELASISFAKSTTREEGAQDLAWALMNSPAFLYNR